MDNRNRYLLEQKIIAAGYVSAKYANKDISVLDFRKQVEETTQYLIEHPEESEISHEICDRPF